MEKDTGIFGETSSLLSEGYTDLLGGKEEDPEEHDDKLLEEICQNINYDKAFIG